MKVSVSCAVAAILGGIPLVALASQSISNAGVTKNTSPKARRYEGNRATDPGSAVPRGGLQEIIVTATRRSENVQRVPITVQVLTGRMLRQLHITSFQDYVQMVPNLTSADNGPGQNEIFMRGIGAGSQATQLSGMTGLWPNVGVYLDNQSVQLPNQNLDVYAVDLNRIEILEGPQGTLFGSGAEAGAIRYITNKPKLDVVEGNVNATYGVTAHGDPNTAVTAVLNLPIIPHHMAVRLVAYNSRQGGYINNVHGTYTRHDTDIGIHYANYPAVNGQCPDGGVNSGYCVPPGSPIADNINLVRNAINPVTYQGARIEALYQFNDDWSLLVTQMNQSMDAEGVFYQYPNAPDGQPLSPLDVVLFTPTYHNDKWSNTAWTLRGKAGPLDLIYTGGLLTRNLDTQTDYTNYSRGIYGDYYQCFGPGSGGDNSLKSTCFQPAQAAQTQQQNQHWQHEFRVETPSAWRLRGILGIYEEDNILYDQTNYTSRTVPTCTSNAPPGSLGNSGCFATVGTFPGTTVVNPGLQSDKTSFYQDGKRETRQIAEFASISFDLTHHLTLTGGARHFVFLNSEVGTVLESFGCFEGGAPATGCHSSYSTNLNALNLRATEQGWRAQANVSWHIAPTLLGHRQHIMTYFTFSQGFRPGGFNQNVNQPHALGPDGVAQFIIPRGYNPDTLNNYEVGWKTDWRFLNRSFQWNTAVYREDWSNVQIELFYPPLTGIAFDNSNGQNFRINGVETSFVAQLWRGLSLRGAGAWNSSEQTNSPAIIDNNPASVNFGKPIAEICSSGPSSCSPFTNPFGPRGAPTADSPPISYNLLLRYDFLLHTLSSIKYLNNAVAYVQIGMQHHGHSYTQAGANPPFVPGVTVTTARLRFENPAYTTYDASVGASKGHWNFAVYGQNLTNSQAVVFTSTDQFIVAQTPLRPRVLGASFGYSF